MLNTFINMVNILNDLVNAEYFIDKKCVKSLVDLDNVVDEIEKKLVK